MATPDYSPTAHTESPRGASDEPPDQPSATATSHQLYLCAAAGDHAGVSAALASPLAGVDMQPAFTAAVSGGHAQVLRALKAALTATGQLAATVGRSALAAIGNDNFTLMARLLADGDPNMPVPDCPSLLHAACWRGNRDIARLLICRGAIVDRSVPTAPFTGRDTWRDEWSTTTPLEVAATMDMPALAVMLVVNGASTTRHARWSAAVPTYEGKRAVALLDKIRGWSPVAVAATYGTTLDASIATLTGRISGWRRPNHHHHIAGLRHAVHTVIACARKCTPPLPAEIWEHVFSFLMRRHWEVQ